MVTEHRFSSSLHRKNVKIGENSIIYSGARIYDYFVIGDNCIIHSNTGGRK